MLLLTVQFLGGLMLLLGGGEALVRDAAASIVSPIEIPARGPVSLAIGAGLTVLLLLMVFNGGLRIRRAEGLILLSAFVAYIAWVLLSTV